MDRSSVISHWEKKKEKIADRRDSVLLFRKRLIGFFVDKISLICNIKYMKWTIDFYKTKSGNCPVRKYLLNLSPRSRIKILETMEYLETFGIELKEPFVKYLGDKIFELRAKDSEGIYRVLYFAAEGKRFIMLHGFTKKTQKTPRKEFEIALKRKKEFSNE